MSGPELSTMSEADLRAHHAGLMAQITELKTKDPITLADRTLLKKLTGEANKVAKAVTEFTDSEAVEELAAVPAPVAEVVAPIAIAADAAEAIAAAAADVVAPAAVSSRPVEDEVVTAGPIVMRASADIPGMSAGTPLETIMDLKLAYEKKIPHVGNTRVVVASASWIDRYAPEDIITEANAMDATAILKDAQRKARAVPKGQPLTAAVGLCGPGDIDFSIRVLGQRGRPLWGSLPKKAAPHGKIQWRAPIGRGTDATHGPITAAQDAAGSSYPKVFAAINCADFISAQVVAHYTGRTIKNWSERFDSELVNAVLEADLIDLDQKFEQDTFAAVLALADTVSVVPTFGSGPTWVNTLNKAAMYLQSRIRTTAAVRVWAPPWVESSILADVVNNRYSTDVQQFLQNVRVTYAMPGDLGYATAAGGVLPAYPAEAQVIMWIDGDVVGMDGGTLETGFYRDSTLNKANEVQHFSEEWSGVAFLGDEMLKFQIPLCESGERAPNGDALTCPVETPGS